MVSCYWLVQEDSRHEVVEDLSDFRVPLDVLLVALYQLVLYRWLSASHVIIDYFALKLDLTLRIVR
jgi:hypothetical protein